MDGPRACLAEELPALLAAASRVFRPSGGDLGHDYPLLFSTANLANLRVIGDRGHIIAHAGLCLRPVSGTGWGQGPSQGEGPGPGPDQGTVRADVGGLLVGAIGAVFTRDDHRNRGLAGAVVADVLSRARIAGAALALASGDGPLYRRLGFSPTPPAPCWDCSPPLTHPDVDVQIVACPPRPRDDDLEILSRLNHAEPVHFRRTDADWRAILGAATVFAWPGQVFIVHQRGRAVAYLAVTRRARRRVLEFAGDRGAILAAAPLVADELVAPWHDAQIAAQARALGWRERALTLTISSLWLAPPDTTLPPPLPWYGLNYV